MIDHDRGCHVATLEGFPEAAGVVEWIFWNPNVLYSRAGFPKG